MPQYVPQVTLQYTSFIKRNLSEALQDAFAGHPDPTVAHSFVGVDFQHRRFTIPAVIIKFYERRLPNAGVGHYEYLPSPDDPDPFSPSEFVLYYHRFYEGDIAFEIWGESAVDRDIMRDALIEVLAMSNASAATTQGGTNFINRFYWSMQNTPYGLWHFPVLNLDLITGYGEQVTIAPWSPEDLLVYKASYRVPIFGEFYSITPNPLSTTGLVEEVDIYPQIQNVDPDPATNPDPGPGWWAISQSNRLPGIYSTGDVGFNGSLTIRRTTIQSSGALGSSGTLSTIKSGP